MSLFVPVAWVDVWATQAALYRQRALLDVGAAMRAASRIGTRTVPLRGPEGDEWGIDDDPISDMPQLAQPDWKPVKALLVRIRQALKTDLGIPQLGRVYLESILPETVLPWTIDEGDYAKTRNRVHIGLVTNPQCILFAGPMSWNVQVGQAVAIDTTVINCAANFSNKPRIHLIVDIRKLDYER